MEPDFQSLADLKQHFIKHQRLFLLITILCLLAYFNALDNDFVSDDIAGIVRNEQIGNIFLTIKNLNGSQFLKSLIFLCFGKSEFAYHAVNIIMHVFASFLVYFFLLIVTGKKHISALATLVFSLHPIHTEAVTWISGRGYVLYSIFFLLSFILFHLYLESKEKTSYFVYSLVFFAMALFSNIWALPLPVIFFLYEKYLKERKVSWSFYLLLLLICGLSLLLRQGEAETTISDIAQGTGTAWRNPAISIPHSLTQYIYLLFWPIGLTLYHEGEVLTSSYLLWARLITLAVLFFLPFIFRKKKLFIFFFLFFLVSISLSLSPVQVAWYVAERYLYLGSISFCVLIAAFLIRLEEKFETKNLAIILLIPILIFYFARTVIRNQDWQTRASLWFATERVSPRSPRVHNNLGDIYGGWGQVDKAIEEFEIARQLQPGYADATHNLGNAYLNKGDLDKAKKYFLEATEYNPYLFQSYHSLGVISYNQGNKEEAKAYFEKTLSINPNYQPSLQALIILEHENNN